MKLLLIEDNHKLAEYISLGLSKAGFSVDLMRTAMDGEEALSVNEYDAVVLDLGLPDRDGMSLLTEIRRKEDTTIILVLTARDSIADRVKGLTEGADDYLVKPFAMAELIARLRVLQRRPSHALEIVLCCGNVRLDPHSRGVQVAEKVLPMSRREIDALEFLMRRANRVVSKALLEETIYSFDDDVASNAVEVLIHRLRKRLQIAEANVAIVTLRGVGYMLSIEAL